MLGVRQLVKIRSHGKAIAYGEPNRTVSAEAGAKMGELDKYLKAAARLLLKRKAVSDQEHPDEQMTGIEFEIDGQLVAVSLTVKTRPA